jgi:hypothetical protein
VCSLKCALRAGTGPNALNQYINVLDRLATVHIAANTEFVSYDADGDFCVPKGKTPGAALLFFRLLKNRNSTRLPDR